MAFKKSDLQSPASDFLKILKAHRLEIISLLFIFFIALFMRMYQLTNLPRGLNWDETAYGYNAYSLLISGKDEWGRAYPLFLKSFGEYKPALLSYLMLPFFLLFPDGNTAVRVVPALLGSFSVLATFFLVKKISKNSLHAILTAFILAVTPWHIHFSRVALDPIVGHSFLLFGMCFWISKKESLRSIGSVLLAASMYGYNAQRLFIPVFLITLAMVWYFQKSRKKSVITRFNLIHVLKQRAVSVGILLFLASVVLGITLFGDVGDRARSASFLDDKLSNSNSISVEWLTKIGIVAEKYATYWRPDFLFMPEGGVNASPILGFPNRGNILEMLLPFFVIGVFFAIKKRQKWAIFFGLWLLLAPLPGAVTLDSPHSGRALGMLPALLVFISYGLIVTSYLISRFLKRWLDVSPQVFLGLLIMAISLNAVSFFYDYARLYPQVSESIWQGQFRSMSEVVKEIQHSVAEKSEVQKPVFISKNSDYHALLFYAWYMRISPEIVAQATRGGYSPFYLAEYQGVKLLEPDIYMLACAMLEPESLLIMTPGDAQNISSKPYEMSYYYNPAGTKEIPAFYIYKTNLLSEDDIIWAKNWCGDAGI